MRNLVLLLLLSSLYSCSTEKKLQRAINKHGQKESCAYFVTHYPEYFKASVVHDTIVDTIVVVKHEYVHDTIVDFDSTYFYENDKLKLDIVRLGKKLSIKAKCKGDTIYVDRKVPVSVTCPPCPDMKTLLPVKTLFESFITYWFWITAVLIVIFAIKSLLNKKNIG